MKEKILDVVFLCRSCPDYLWPSSHLAHKVLILTLPEGKRPQKQAVEITC